MLFVGDIVKCIVDFSQHEKDWGMKYPNQGEFLMIKKIEPHPSFPRSLLLTFWEFPNLPLSYLNISSANFIKMNVPTYVEVISELKIFG